MPQARGRLIVAIGLPCSGKSTVMAAAAKLSGVTCFVEPEEADWPKQIRNSGYLGHGIAITWFRAVRVAALLNADALRQAGAHVFVDCYYDKLMKLYLHAKAFEWLLPKNDPYYPVIQELAELDFVNLPDADCVVTFTVSSANWESRIQGRSREFDWSAKLQTAFEMQELYLNAADKYCASKNSLSLRFNNDQPGVREAAARLIEMLGTAQML